ncbi:hypothetical protein [Paenibacillus hamazuiensis]|uniref:hypothetical protein n=1 Tax=Paenibacillus hamazuiensis TaxID=2936508 RepID=UPI00200BD3EB|nr:hypothetical protein [Paenibacillus hamazuiensis]
MNRVQPHLSTIDLIGKLADLKDQHYRNTLALSAVIELLIEKGCITAEEIRSKAAQLDAASIPHPADPTA